MSKKIISQNTKQQEVCFIPQNLKFKEFCVLYHETNFKYSDHGIVKQQHDFLDVIFHLQSCESFTYRYIIGNMTVSYKRFSILGNFDSSVVKCQQILTNPFNFIRINENRK